MTRCIDLAFERPERGSGTIQGLAPVHNRLLRNALIAFTVADLIPAAVLALTFYPPFVQRLTWHGTGRSVPEVRVACVVSLAALALLFVFRKRLEALLDRLDADVRAAAATEPLDAPAATPRGPYVVLVALAIVIAMVAVALAFASPPQFRAFIAEDGLVEYASALAWLAAAACALTALSLDSHQFGRKLAFYLPLIALFVFCGGEEISWGQRLLHYQTPAWLASNKQHEINLHDIGSISVNENAFFVFTTLCCLVGPWLLARAPAWRVYLRRLNAPIMDPVVAQVYGIGLAAWVVVGVRFGTLGFSPLSLWGYYTQMDDEIWEFYAALGFCALTALDLAHRLAESRRMRVPASYAQRTAPTLRGASNSSEARNSGRPVHPTPIAAAAPRRRFSEIREQ